MPGIGGIRGEPGPILVCTRHLIMKSSKERGLSEEGGRKREREREIEEERARETEE